MQPITDSAKPCSPYSKTFLRKTQKGAEQKLPCTVQCVWQNKNNMSHCIAQAHGVDFDVVSLVSEQHIANGQINRTSTAPASLKVGPRKPNAKPLLS
jgi:hypothetical protein